MKIIDIESLTSKEVEGKKQDMKMVRKRNSPILLKKVLVVWIEDETSHNIPLSRCLNRSKALTLQFKSEKGKEAEVSRGGFLRFKERSCVHNLKVQGEARVLI